jgi:hypothetical protein
MLLTVSNLPPLDQPHHFEALFGRYIYGFKPGRHCDPCFVARREMAVVPHMKNGSHQLRDELFYLCGVGRDHKSKPHLTRRSTNIHLAVRPRKGSVAAIGSVYGATFVIEDAEAIAIPPVPDEVQGLKRCKMFQLAYSLFEVDQGAASEGVAVHQLRKQWIGIPGIRQDASGLMLDPNIVH